MLNYRNLDWKLIFAALLLSAIGIMLIMSAQHYADSDYKQSYYERQALWLLIAFLFFLIIVHVPIRMFDASAYLIYAVAIILLVLVFVMLLHHLKE